MSVKVTVEGENKEILLLINSTVTVLPILVKVLSTGVTIVVLLLRG